MGRAAAVLLVALIAAVPARAEEALVVVDDAGQVLGPVVGLGNYNNGDIGAVFIVRQGTEFGALRVDSGVRVRTAFPAPYDSRYFYFAPGDCSGPPLGIDPIYRSSDLPVLFPYVDELFRVDTGQTIQVLAASRRESAYSGPNPYTCEPLTPANINVNPISLWGTLSFTPPLRVDLNPLIFSDGFGTGDASRWSNY